MVKVIAKEKGFYGSMIRKAGEEFNFILGEGEKLPKWVEKLAGKVAAEQVETVEEKQEPKAPAKPAGKKEPATEAEKINAATGATQPDWEAPKAPAAGAEI